MSHNNSKKKRGYIHSQANQPQPTPSNTSNTSAGNHKKFKSQFNSNSQAYSTLSHSNTQPHHVLSQSTHVQQPINSPARRHSTKEHKYSHLFGSSSDSCLSSEEDIVTTPRIQSNSTHISVATAAKRHQAKNPQHSNPPQKQLDKEISRNLAPPIPSLRKTQDHSLAKVLFCPSQASIDTPSTAPRQMLSTSPASEYERSNLPFDYFSNHIPLCHSISSLHTTNNSSESHARHFFFDLDQFFAPPPSSKNALLNTSIAQFPPSVNPTCVPPKLSSILFPVMKCFYPQLVLTTNGAHLELHWNFQTPSRDSLQHIDESTIQRHQTSHHDFHHSFVFPNPIELASTFPVPSQPSNATVRTYHNECLHSLSLSSHLTSCSAAAPCPLRNLANIMTSFFILHCTNDFTSLNHSPQRRTDYQTHYDAFKSHLHAAKLSPFPSSFSSASPVSTHDRPSPLPRNYPSSNRFLIAFASLRFFHSGQIVMNISVFTITVPHIKTMMSFASSDCLPKPASIINSLLSPCENSPNSCKRASTTCSSSNTSKSTPLSIHSYFSIDPIKHFVYYAAIPSKPKRSTAWLSISPLTISHNASSIKSSPKLGSTTRVSPFSSMLWEILTALYHPTIYPSTTSQTSVDVSKCLHTNFSQYPPFPMNIPSQLASCSIFTATASTIAPDGSSLCLYSSESALYLSIGSKDASTTAPSLRCIASFPSNIISVQFSGYWLTTDCPCFSSTSFSRSSSNKPKKHRNSISQADLFQYEIVVSLRCGSIHRGVFSLDWFASWKAQLSAYSAKNNVQLPELCQFALLSTIPSGFAQNVQILGTKTSSLRVLCCSLFPSQHFLFIMLCAHCSSIALCDESNLVPAPSTVPSSNKHSPLYFSRGQMTCPILGRLHQRPYEQIFKCIDPHLSWAVPSDGCSHGYSSHHRGSLDQLMCNQYVSFSGCVCRKNYASQNKRPSVPVKGPSQFAVCPNTQPSNYAWFNTAWREGYTKPDQQSIELYHHEQQQQQQRFLSSVSSYRLSICLQTNVILLPISLYSSLQPITTQTSLNLSRISSIVALHSPIPLCTNDTIAQYCTAAYQCQFEFPSFRLNIPPLQRLSLVAFSTEAAQFLSEATTNQKDPLFDFADFCVIECSSHMQ